MLSKIIKTILIIVLAAIWGYVACTAWTCFVADEMWMRRLAGLLALYSCLVGIVASLIVALWWRKI